MDTPVLARYSIRSKQEYIFRTNRLVEITGASMIIAGIFQVLFTCANVCGFRCDLLHDSENGKTSARFNLSDVLRRFREKSLDMVELFTGGGNCTVLYRDRGVARAVNMRYTKKILEDFPGLLPLYVGIPLEMENEAFHYGRDMAALKEAEETEKNRMFPARGSLALPFSRTDQATYQPVSGFAYPGGRRTEFSAESLSKQKYMREHSRNSEGRSLDDIGPRLAIVHADGNNMGLKIRRRLDGKTNYDECVTEMRKFTREISGVYEAGRRELDAAYQALPQKKQGGHYPVRWLVSAGDDATFICNAKYAGALTEAYLRGVSSWVSDSGQRYSACAGICVFRAHYPCARAYAMAEQACDSAKEPVHSAAGEMLSEEGWLDFHVIKSGVGGDLRDLRLLWGLTVQSDKQPGKVENRCITRPWQVCGTMRERERDFANLRKLADILERCGVSRGRLVTLGSVIEADWEQGRLEWDKLCYRNDLRRQNDRRPLPDLNREAAKLYPNWNALGRALFDLSEVYDLWYQKEGAK